MAFSDRIERTVEFAQLPEDAYRTAYDGQHPRLGELADRLDTAA